jgi:hypothetical protein
MRIPVAVIPNYSASGVVPLQIGHKVLVLNINPAREQHAVTDGPIQSRL